MIGATHSRKQNGHIFVVTEMIITNEQFTGFDHAILVCSLVFATGCTGLNGTAAPAPATPEYIALESLILTPSERSHKILPEREQGEKPH